MIRVRTSPLFWFPAKAEPLWLRNRAAWNTEEPKILTSGTGEISFLENNEILPIERKKITEFRTTSRRESSTRPEFHRRMRRKFRWLELDEEGWEW